MSCRSWARIGFDVGKRTCGRSCQQSVVGLVALGCGAAASSADSVFAFVFYCLRCVKGTETVRADKILLRHALCLCCSSLPKSCRLHGILWPRGSSGWKLNLPGPPFSQNTTMHGLGHSVWRGSEAFFITIIVCHFFFFCKPQHV